MYSKNEHQVLKRRRIWGTLFLHMYFSALESVRKILILFFGDVVGLA